MANRVPPHKCALPNCNVITRNERYCCKSHAALGQAKLLETGERECAHCREIKPMAKFIHVDSSGHRRLRSWCSECREGLSKTAQERRTASIRARAEQRREAETPPPVPKDPSLWMVEPKGLFPGVTLDMTKLGGLPGTSVWAHPWPA